MQFEGHPAERTFYYRAHLDITTKKTMVTHRKLIERRKKKKKNILSKHNIEKETFKAPNLYMNSTIFEEEISQYEYKYKQQES